MKVQNIYFCFCFWYICKVCAKSKNALAEIYWGYTHLICFCIYFKLHQYIIFDWVDLSLDVMPLFLYYWQTHFILMNASYPSTIWNESSVSYACVLAQVDKWLGCLCRYAYKGPHLTQRKFLNINVPRKTGSLILHIQIIIENSEASSNLIRIEQLFFILIHF